MTECRRRQVWKTTSAQSTFALGESLGHSLVGGLTIGLAGPLGAGKTQLVKGIAIGNALDDADRVTSPTFTLVHEYPGRLTLYHLDAYRLGGGDELTALGFDELIAWDSAVVVEWADRVASVMPDDTLWIDLKVAGETDRTLVFRARGATSNRCLAALRAAHVDTG